MKTLWNAVSFLAVVHLLAVLMFLGWLWHSDRLDGQRLQDLRAMFAVTISEADAAAAQAAAEAEVLDRQKAVEARRQSPPLPAADQVQRVALSQQEQQRSDRHVELVRRQLLEQFNISSQQLEAEREALEARRQGLQQSVEADEGRRSDTQLTKAVKLLESLPPKQAKETIVELVQSGKTDQAVIYLDTMNSRAAGKVLAEFKTDEENKLATELLERIRTLGLQSPETGVSKVSSDADTVANAP
jgi:hypothetical protein